jgi:hypothetical protein
LDMKLCPKCFAPVEEAGFACCAPHCSRAGIPVPPAAGQKEGTIPLCPACQSRMTVKVCLECGFELDPDALQRGLLCFSLVGDQGVGKSNYLAVLMRELSGEFCRVYGATLYPTGGDRTMDRYQRNYARSLFDLGICVPPTDREDVDPLTYTLMFPPNSEAGSTCSLAFYDACGKNFESEANMALYNRSIYHSAGILLLIDPSQLPAIRQQRSARGLPLTPGDPQTLLLRTVHLLRTGLGLESVDKKIPVPLAVCITKMDTLFHQLDPASFLRDPSRNLRRPMVCAADFSSCSLEMESLLEVWGAGELLRHVKSQFEDWCFFGLSALGNSPGKQGEIPRISPHRVLDPLLWLLWRNQILRAG